VLAHAFELVLLITVYVVSARLGLSMGPVSGFATLVWPPTGIALAALLLRGVRVWPAVTLGAIMANVLTGATFWVALAIGVGNTLEALLAVSLLRRFAGFHFRLDRLVDVVALVALAAGLSTVVSATFECSRSGRGIVQPAQVGETWRAWWVGDALGDLVVAPVLLTWSALGD
jgi:integral membrane sensor domain MASE1